MSDPIDVDATPSPPVVDVLSDSEPRDDAAEKAAVHDFLLAQALQQQEVEAAGTELDGDWASDSASSDGSTSASSTNHRADDDDSLPLDDEARRQFSGFAAPRPSAGPTGKRSRSPPATMDEARAALIESLQHSGPLGQRLEMPGSERCFAAPTSGGVAQTALAENAAAERRHAMAVRAEALARRDTPPPAVPSSSISAALGGRISAPPGTTTLVPAPAVVPPSAAPHVPSAVSAALRQPTLFSVQRGGLSGSSPSEGIRSTLSQRGLRVARTAKLTVKDSDFVAFRVTPIATPQDVTLVVRLLRTVAPNASHYVSAHVLTSGVQGFDDDGEDHAGKKVLGVLKERTRLGDPGVCVVVARWFGGTLLGPQRFTIIARCTHDAFRAPLMPIASLA